MVEKLPTRTKRSAAAEANMLFGPGWLLPIAIALAAGGVGYQINGIAGVFYAETATGGVAGVILYIKSLLDGTKTHIWVPVEREEDDES